MLLHRTHGTEDAREYKYRKKKLENSSDLESTYTGTEKTDPEKRLGRPPESTARLTSKGLSLYSAST